MPTPSSVSAPKFTIGVDLVVAAPLPFNCISIGDVTVRELGTGVDLDEWVHQLRQLISTSDEIVMTPQLVSEMLLEYTPIAHDVVGIVGVYLPASLWVSPQVGTRRPKSQPFSTLPKGDALRRVLTRDWSVRQLIGWNGFQCSKRVELVYGPTGSNKRVI